MLLLYGTPPIGVPELDQAIRPAAESAVPRQPSCPQSQKTSVVLRDSSQAVLQYLLPSSAGQLQFGWAHFSVRAVCGIGISPQMWCRTSFARTAAGLAASTGADAETVPDPTDEQPESGILLEGRVVSLTPTGL